MTRVLSALALLPLVVGIIWFLPPLATVVFAELVLLVAVMEYAELVTGTGLGFTRVPTYAAVLATGATMAVAPGMLSVVLLAAVVVIGATQLAAGTPNGLLGGAAAATLAVVYLGLPVGAMAAVRVEAGPETLLLFLAVIMASDTAQYYGGRRFGRRPLAPVISPKKTVEGAVFGFVAGALVFGLAGEWGLAGVGPFARVVLGATLAGLGIAGDLFESGLKRAADMKDASGLIPGHGGLLDRLDGLLFAAPLYYTVVHLTRAA